MLIHRNHWLVFSSLKGADPKDAGRPHPKFNVLIVQASKKARQAFIKVVASLKARWCLVVGSRR